MKKFYVGVKGVVVTDKGLLLIKHHEGYWDMPGGRLDDDEDLDSALLREFKEELPNCNLNSIGEMVGAYRLHKDIVEDTSLVIIFFQVDVTLPETIELSDEHTEYLWINKVEDIPEVRDPAMKKIVVNVLSQNSKK